METFTYGDLRIKEKDRYGLITIEWWGNIHSTYINQEELKQLIGFLTNQLEK